MAQGLASPRAGADTAPPVPLLDLAPGTVAVLRQVTDRHSRAVLRSLGLTDGARLRVCRVGDPCIVQVRATRIGLSRTVAEAVFVLVEAEVPA